MRSILNNALPYAAIVLFFGVVVYPQLLVPNELIRLSDFIIPHLNPQVNLEYFFYTWDGYGVGIPNSSGIQSAAIFVINRFLSLPLTQQTWGFAPALVASLNMYYFISKAELLKSRALATLLAIAYVVNWGVFSYAGDGSTLLTVTGYMWNYAFMPLILLYAYKILIVGEFSRRAVIWLTVWISLAYLINPQAIVLVPGILVPFVAHYAIARVLQTKRNRRRAVTRLACMFAVAGSLMFVLVLPVTVRLLIPFFVASGSSQGLQSLFGFKATLMPLRDMYIHMYPTMISPFLVSSGPDASGFFSTLGISGPLLIGFFVMLERDRTKRSWGLILLAYLILMATWIAASRSGDALITGAYRLPVVGNALQVLRNPWKWLLLITPILFTLLALGIENMRLRLSFEGQHSNDRAWYTRKRSSRALLLLLVIGFFVGTLGNHNFRLLDLGRTYSFPIDPFSRSGAGGLHSLPWGRIQRPLLEAAQELNLLQNDGGYFRVLWLPSETEISIQTTQIYMNSILFFPNSADMANYQQLIAGQLSAGSPGLTHTLALLNVKYVVVLKYLEQTGPPRIWGQNDYVVGNPMEIQAALDDQPGLAIMKNEREYAIYEVK